MQRTKEKAALDHDIASAEQKLALEHLTHEVEAVCKRFEAAKGGLAEVVQAIRNDETLVKVAEAMSVQHMLGGDSFVDVIRGIFAGTHLEDFGHLLGKKVATVAASNGQTALANK